MQNYELDELDRKILRQLLKDSRYSYQEMARDFIVSGGTIHVRINKMKEAGIIKGSKIIVDPQKLGFDIISFIGVNLKSAVDYHQALQELEKLPEVVEAHYTTGQYGLLIKVACRNTQDLHSFLVEKLQPIDVIQSTETLICLDSPIAREAMV